MREIKFRVFEKSNGRMKNIDELTWHQGKILFYEDSDLYSEPMQYTGYKMFSKDVFFDYLVSNNFKTDKEVIRQIVFYKGCIMMKRVKGKSSLPVYLPLHEWFNMNFHVIGNIHENPELL